MTTTGYSPNTNANLVAGTKQQQTRDKLDEFLMITEKTNDAGQRYYAANSYTRALDSSLSSASTGNFIASLGAIEKILNDPKFRRGMPPSDYQEALKVYTSILADCGVAAQSGKYNYNRSLQVRQGYEALASQPGEPTFNTGVDPRSLYANSLGRQYFTANEQLLLGQKYGLPIDQSMNPNGAAAQGLFMKFVAKHTNDPANYDLKIGDSPFTHADLTNRDITTFTGDEYNAVREAFIVKAKKNGIDNAWLTIQDPTGRQVPNDALFQYLIAVADSKVTATSTEPEKLKAQLQEQTAMYTAIKFFQISAAIEANRMNTPTTMLAGNTTPTTTTPTPSSVDTALYT